jgi:energy-coupling factor transport system ATP-binding protein
VTVQLRGFGWRYAGRRAWALRGLDLRIEAGERVLLLGPSGAGKSTLLAALAGLLAEDSGEREGEARVDGRAGVLFQDPQTQLVMSRSGDDVAFGLENLGVDPALIWPRVDEALRAVVFRYPRDHRTDALSGGEQQRLALAGVLALHPGLLLLDEPTANLDPAGATAIRAAVAVALAGRRTTLVLVEHRIADALPLVDRVVVLEPGGGVHADGPPEKIFSEYGQELAAAGVWVPGRYLPRPPSPRIPQPQALPAHRGGRPGPELMTGEGLTFRHPAAVHPALSELDIVVRAGENLAVLGPNGSGKSTLALLLGGLLAPTAGRVAATAALAGPDAGTPPHRWRARVLARRIGSVFQDPEQQFLTNSVRGELTLGAGSNVDELLSRLRLDRLASANPYTLSGGEQRRLSVATALAARPRLLVLDEPTFGQDRRTWIEMVDLLAALRDEGRGVVTVTHDPDFVAALADRTVTLGRPL